MVPQYVGPGGVLTAPGVFPAAIDIDLLAFVADGSGSALRVSSASVGGDHTLVANGDGTYRFTAAPGFVGTARIHFTVADEGGRSGTFDLDLTVGGTTEEPPAVPSAPQSLTATVVPGPLVQLSWVDTSSGEDGFHVYRKTLPGGSYAAIGEATSPTFPDPSVTIGATYAYQVTAFNSAGESAGSNEAQVTIAVTAPFGGTAFELTTGRATHIEAEEHDVGGVTGNRKRYTAESLQGISPSSFEVTTRVRNAGTSAARIHFEIDGVGLTGPIDVPPTGSGYRLLRAASLAGIPAGASAIDLVVDTGAPVVDWFRFDKKVVALDSFGDQPGGTQLQGRTLEYASPPVAWASNSTDLTIDGSGVLRPGPACCYGAMVPVDYDPGTDPFSLANSFIEKGTVQADIDPGGTTVGAGVGFFADTSGSQASRELDLLLTPTGHFQLYVQAESQPAAEGIARQFKAHDFNQLRLEYGQRNADGTLHHTVSAWVNGVKVLHEFLLDPYLASHSLPAIDPNYAGALMIWDPATATHTPGVDNVAFFWDYDTAVLPPAPQAVADEDTTNEGQPRTIFPTSNDRVPLEGSWKTWVALEPPPAPQPTLGAPLVRSGQSIDYSPLLGEFGDDRFAYRLTSLLGVAEFPAHSTTAEIVMHVREVDLPPSAVPDSFVVQQDTAKILDVLANDSTTEPGATLTVIAVGTPSVGGSATIAAGGSKISYVPANGYVGGETFNYTIGDGTGETASAKVTVRVNAPPAAIISKLDCDAQLHCTFDGSGSTDRENGSNLTFRWEFGDGTFSNLVSGTHSFPGAGPYVVRLVVTDLDGASDSATRSTSPPLEEDDLTLLLVILN